MFSPIGLLTAMPDQLGQGTCLFGLLRSSGWSLLEEVSKRGIVCRVSTKPALDLPVVLLLLGVLKFQKTSNAILRTFLVVELIKGQLICHFGQFDGDGVLLCLGDVNESRFVGYPLRIALDPEGLFDAPNVGVTTRVAMVGAEIMNGSLEILLTKHSTTSSPSQNGL